MKDALKRFFMTVAELAKSTVIDPINNVCDGIEDGDIGKVAKNMAFLSCIVCFILLIGYILVKLAFRHSVFLVITGFLVASAISLYRKVTGVVEPEPIQKPTVDDYNAVQKTLKPALVKVAPALGLAPIHAYTDITLDPDDMITEHGKVWRLGFGALKKTAGVDINEDLCKRVIQAQVKSILERENPAGFSNVRFPYGGRLEPVIQIDEILQDDAYVFIFAVIASEVYFRQKFDWKNQASPFYSSGVDTEDDDF